MTDPQTERIIEHHAKIYHRFRHLGPEVARAAADDGDLALAWVCGVEVGDE